MASSVSTRRGGYLPDQLEIERVAVAKVEQVLFSVPGSLVTEAPRAGPLQAAGDSTLSR